MVLKQSLAGFKFEPNWKILCLAGIFFPLLISLGVWQLHRADEKRVLLAEMDSNRSKPPLSWADYQKTVTDSDGKDRKFRQVLITGQFDPQKYWLIENQIWQGRVGYHVVSPFYVDDQRWILVDRGWVAGTGYRAQPPEVKTPAGQQQIRANIMSLQSHALLENEAVVMNEAWPKLMLQIRPDIKQAQLGRSELPAVVRLSASDPNAFMVAPQSVNMPPSKHVAYATQWFLLAGVLVILTFFANSNITAVIKRPKS